MGLSLTYMSHKNGYFHYIVTELFPYTLKLKLPVLMRISLRMAEEISPSIA